MIKKKTHSQRVKTGLAKSKLVDEFLWHSNYIESVYDEDSFKQAKLAWKYLMKQKSITPKVILETHRILMCHQDLRADEIGFFRRCEVTVGGRYGLNWVKVPLAVEEWCQDVETSMEVPAKDGKHFEIDHISYETIHPFVDGNGRTGRLFWNWERIKSGLPLKIIHTGGEQFEYYKLFRK
jgi:Fic family protein